MKRRYSLLALLVLAIPLLGAGCSSDSDEPGAEGTTTTTDSSTTTGKTTSTRGGAAQGGTGSVDAAPFVTALASALTKTKSTFGVAPEPAACIAPRWLESLGLEPFQGAELTPEKIEQQELGLTLVRLAITDTQAGTMLDAYAACDVNLREQDLSRTGESDFEDNKVKARACREAILTEEAFVPFATSLLRGQMVPELDALISCAFY